MKKKILVTGGAGYIGSALVPALLEKGYDVKVFDSMIFGDVGLVGVKDKIELVVGDVVNLPNDIMDGVFGVIHLAGFSTDPTAYFNPRRTDLVNHLGTEYVAQRAKKAGVERFVFASSCSVYFTYDSPLIPPPNTEEDVVNSISPYSISKRSAEEALLELVDEKFQPTILRKGTLYGFAPKMRYDLVLNSFTKDAFKLGRITVNAGGDIYRPLLDIKDAVATYIAALELPLEKIGGKIFNASHWNTRIGDFAEEFKKMVKEFDGKDIEIDTKFVGTGRNYQVDNKKFLDAFGLAPARPVRDAILEVWTNMKNGHDFDNPVYYTDRWYRKINEESSKK